MICLVHAFSVVSDFCPKIIRVVVITPVYPTAERVDLFLLELCVGFCAFHADNVRCT